jgi:hypothetical protein
MLGVNPGTLGYHGNTIDLYATSGNEFFGMAA